MEKILMIAACEGRANLALIDIDGLINAQISNEKIYAEYDPHFIPRKGDSFIVGVDHTKMYTVKDIWWVYEKDLVIVVLKPW